VSVDSLRLTFAELEFGLERSPGWAVTRRRLGIAEPADGSAVAAAGLASLIVRELVLASPPEGLSMSPELGAALALLQLPSHWLDVACTGEDGTLGAYVGLAEDAPIVVLSLAAPGVFEVRAVESGGDVPAAFAQVIGGLVSSTKSVLVGYRGTEANSRFEVLRGSDGELTLYDHVDSAPALATKESVVARASALAAAVLQTAA